jgi:hypothetical protein
VNPIKTCGLFVAALVAALCCPPASAQSTDGYHSIQIFPLVVETASFAQRFNFRNPNASTVTIKSTFYPDVAYNAAKIECNDTVVAPGKSVMVPSLRTLCPNMAVSQFGYLYTSEVSGENLPYAAFSRAASPQAGIGFTVEAFPAHTFTSADTVVTGLRRLAASGSSPPYQTNCFVANLNEVSGASASTQVLYTLYDNLGNQIGNGSVTLLPGQSRRMSDIFTIAGAPAGDWNDATIKFEEVGVDEPGIMTYCTVQESLTFGADFRIGKQELGSGGLANPSDVIGSQDNHVTRNTVTNVDAVGRPFTIPGGDFANTHIMYFRHPDYVQCELVDTNGARLPLSYNLEMRMVDQDGQLVAGGNGVTGWGEVYLGDKTKRNNGSNTRYRIEVEDADQGASGARPYRLHCQSGSGHTMGDIIRYQEAIDRF